MSKKQITLTEKEQLDYLTHEILKLKKQTANNIISIGQNLFIIKQKLEYGEFTKYLEEKVDIGCLNREITKNYILKGLI